MEALKNSVLSELHSIPAATTIEETKMKMPRGSSMGKILSEKDFFVKGRFTGGSVNSPVIRAGFPV